MSTTCRWLPLSLVVSFSIWSSGGCSHEYIYIHHSLVLCYLASSTHGSLARWLLRPSAQPLYGAYVRKRTNTFLQTCMRWEFCEHVQEFRETHLRHKAHANHMYLTCVMHMSGPCLAHVSYEMRWSVLLYLAYESYIYMYVHIRRWHTIKNCTFSTSGCRVSAMFWASSVSPWVAAVR